MLNHCKSFKCETCDKIFGAKRSLQQHLKLVHENIKSEKCNLCDKAFGSNQQLRIHLKIVHQKTNEKKETCKLCSKTFHYKWNLASHMKYLHRPHHLRPINYHRLRNEARAVKTRALVWHRVQTKYAE